ncbi:MAG: hypothetical protein OEY49_08915 [Candidatus Heimdallarchaeota archaeon]|nr:hypothetical protein [Candidatus Heimdallarchaeota archaeon]
MIFNRLFPYIQETRDIPIKGSGLKGAELKALEKLDMIKLSYGMTSKGIKSKSPTDFSLTKFGKGVVKLYNRSDESKVDILQDVKSDFNLISEGLKILNSRIEVIGSALGKISLESDLSLGGTAEHFDRSTIIDELFNVQKQVNPNFTKGPLVSTEIFYNFLVSRYNLSNDRINEILYDLYEIRRIELQMGEPINNDARSVVSPSGRRFDWGRVLEGY